jgi:hypothetical protein
MSASRPVGDDIRGVGPHHSRIHPESQADLDRLIERSGVSAPWHATFDPAGEAVAKIERRAVAAVRALLFEFIRMGPRRREIIFARLAGLEWHMIGDSVLNGASAQAAQKEFADVLNDFPAMRRVFPTKET